jgi:hypothetical protein
MTFTMTADLRRLIVSMTISMFKAGLITAQDMIYAFSYYLTPPVGSNVILILP